MFHRLDFGLSAKAELEDGLLDRSLGAALKRRSSAGYLA